MENATTQTELLNLATAGDPEAQHQMGILALMDIWSDADPELAKEWFEKAATQGYEPAKLELQRIANPELDFIDFVVDACWKNLAGHPDVGPEKPYVLVIDDEESMIDLIEETLSGLHVELAQARTGEAAIELVKKTSNIALIILDYKLPGLNGLQVLNSIRNLPNGDSINVIMISGYSEPSHIVQAKKSGVLSWMVKPFEHKKVRALVAKILESARPAESGK